MCLVIPLPIRLCSSDMRLPDVTIADAVVVELDRGDDGDVVLHVRDDMICC